MRISSLSRQFVRVSVSATEQGVAMDPTEDPVYMAFTLGADDPDNGDWNTAMWEVDRSTYYARCLVGPAGTITLDVGNYAVWVKVTDDPEAPVRRVGRLTVT